MTRRETTMTTTETVKRRAILAFMLNRPGVLNKISMLIRRKMYNVETITACATHDPTISRMTLTLREDRDDKMVQIIRQIEKMTEVISARELDIDGSYWREVAIVKFEADSAEFDVIRQKYHLEILDRQNHERYIVQVGGTSKMIDDFIQAIGKEKIIDVARSGFTALEK